jgi:hypothetical protein
MVKSAFEQPGPRGISGCGAGGEMKFSITNGDFDWLLPGHIFICFFFHHPATGRHRLNTMKRVVLIKL